MNAATLKVSEALRTRGRLVRASDTQGRAKCPLHHDVKPSLTFGDYKGGCRLRCWAGCPYKAVVEALGLRPADLYASPISREARAQQAIVATYTYVGTDDQPIVQKLRYGPHKSFSWRHLENGTWRNDAAGLTLPLYQQDNLTDARLVLVVEGEKAVKAAFGMGFTATCAPFGSTTWTTDYTDTLWRAGAYLVVVLPDNDRPGEKFGARVAASCYAFRPDLSRQCPDLPGNVEPWADWPVLQAGDPEAEPLKVKLVDLPDLPPGGDLCDWLERGGTASVLTDLISAAAFWSPPTPRDTRLRNRELSRVRMRRYRARQADVTHVYKTGTEKSTEVLCTYIRRVTRNRDFGPLRLAA
jgi:hypothetical protein